MSEDNNQGFHGFSAFKEYIEMEAKRTNDNIQRLSDKVELKFEQVNNKIDSKFEQVNAKIDSKIELIETRMQLVEKNQAVMQREMNLKSGLVGFVCASIIPAIQFLMSIVKH